MGRHNGPFYFDRQNDADYIPATPWGNNIPLDPNRRDPQIKPDAIADWCARQPRWRFDVTSGELSSRSFMTSLDAREVNAVLDEAETKYTQDAIKAVVLHLAPECAQENSSLLNHYGYERKISRETGGYDCVPHMIFVGPPRRWRR